MSESPGRNRQPLDGVEPQFQANPAWLASVVVAVADALIVVDPQQHILFFSKGAEWTFGYSADEIVGQPLDRLLPARLGPRHRGHVRQFAVAPEMARLMADRQEVVGLRRDGREFPAEASISKLVEDGVVTALAVVVRDVSRRRQAETALRESEERFRHAFEYAPFGMAIVGLNGRLLQVNQSACQMFGYSAAELLQKTFQELTHPDDLQVGVELFQDLLAGRRDYGWQEKRYVSKDGRVICTLLSTSAVRDEHGAPLYLVSQIQDITERKQAEVRLAESEQRYRSIFESTGEGVLIYDLDGCIVDCNPAAADMHGYSREEFCELQPEQYIHPDYVSLFADFVVAIQAGEQFRARSVDVRRDGTDFPVEVHGATFIYGGKAHALVLLRDITEQAHAMELLERRVEERTRELATLLEVSASLASTLDLRPLLELILEQLQMVVDYTAGNIAILEGDGLRNVGYRGPDPEAQVTNLRLTREQLGELWTHLCGLVPLIVDDVHEDTPLAQALRQAPQGHVQVAGGYLRSWMAIPLLVRDRAIGWLTLGHSRPHAYSARHASLAHTFANHAAVAIENAQLYEQARRLAVLEERQRLARELHDSVSQALYGIGLGARTARALLDRDPAQAAEPLEYVLSLADAGLAEMRALIFELRPDSLEKEGLVAALSRQAAAFKSRHKLQVQTEFCEEPSLPFAAKEALFRIAQEALNNAVKHAQASEVTIRLDNCHGEIALEIHDNGTGFDPKGLHPGHLGLESMRERAIQLGGQMDIVSEPERGTWVRVTLPPQQML